jgi:hypothetical protein
MLRMSSGELLAQVVNVHLHRVALCPLVPAVEALLQLIPAQHPAALGDELLQQLVLVGVSLTGSPR